MRSFRSLLVGLWLWTNRQATAFVSSLVHPDQKIRVSISFLRASTTDVVAIENDDAEAINVIASNLGRDCIKLIDVKSGWGNGDHPTTQLCMRFVQQYVKFGDCFLDYGTGSGILSILAAKLGAKKCIAVDIDEDSLRAATTNAKLNQCDDVIDVVHTKLVYVGDDRFPQCDVTVANILPVSSFCEAFKICFTFHILTQCNFNWDF